EHSVEELWEEIKEGRLQTAVVPDDDGAVNARPSTPFLTLVMISDTHCELGKMIDQNLIPPGDVLIHAGDITVHGDEQNLIKFNEELGRLPHPHKLVISGNHELGFDPEEDVSRKKCEGTGTPEGWKLLTNCTFLHDSSTVACDSSRCQIDGVTFYGASWHPLEGYPFYRPREQLREKWERIPDDVDVVITHSPPIGPFTLWIGMIFIRNRSGYLDVYPHSTPPERWGCRYLLERVEKLRPFLHVFGHTHDCYGAVTNGHTLFVNAASSTVTKGRFNRPLVAYIPKKI
ncbi:hypothetical protein PMAYCL1PPCAC_15031, partial [Pristionchus mayeri]